MVRLERTSISMCRCECGTCTMMTVEEECKCCQEFPIIRDKLDALPGPHLECITQHPGFNTVCLDVWVLQTAYYEYRERYGNMDNPLNEYV